eukprot:9483015-Pyramimonas_sp.AAC.2
MSVGCAAHLPNGAVGDAPFQRTQLGHCLAGSHLMLLDPIHVRLQRGVHRRDGLDTHQQTSRASHRRPHAELHADRAREAVARRSAPEMSSPKRGLLTMRILREGILSRRG